MTSHNLFTYSSEQQNLRMEIEQLLFYEARCLDEQRWEDWLSIYHEDANYWVPTSRMQESKLQ